MTMQVLSADVIFKVKNAIKIYFFKIPLVKKGGTPETSFNSVNKIGLLNFTGELLCLQSLKVGKFSPVFEAMKIILEFLYVAYRNCIASQEDLKSIKFSLDLKKNF